MSTSDPDDQVADAGDVSDHASGGTAPGMGDPQALLHELATSVALLPQQQPADGEEISEGAIALPVIEQDGTKYVAVFTSEQALQAAGADVATALPIPLAELAASWPSEDLWLAVNPGSQDGLALPPEVVRALPGFVEAPAPDDTGQTESG